MVILSSSGLARIPFHTSTARTEDASVLALCQHVCQLANLQMKCVVA